MKKAVDIMPVESWPDEKASSVWVRDQDGSFRPKSWRDEKIDDGWLVSEAAAAVGCALSLDPQDGANASKAARFPSSFIYSPVTGKPLLRQKAPGAGWLPPYGNAGLQSDLIRGGKLTTASVFLGGHTQQEDALPDSVLPPLPGGVYRFLVARFGLQDNFLVACDFIRGALYCWMAGRGRWEEFKGVAGADYLGADMIPEQLWNLECIDLEGESIVYWPCDAGLARVRINPLTLSYKTELLTRGECHSQPLLLGEAMYVLVRPRPGAELNLVEIETKGEGRVKVRLDNIPCADWHAAATTHEVLWLCSRGQVIVNPKRGSFDFHEWKDPTLVPKFQLGPVHGTNTGRLWMQAFRGDRDEGERGFVSVGGKNQQDWQHSEAPRAMSGKSSIKSEQRLKDDPWIEPEVVSMDARDNNEAVVPLLESVTDGSMLVFRVDHLYGIEKFFETADDQKMLVRFQVLEQHSGERGFYSALIRAPWKTTAFIYHGILYLQHPDIQDINGWSLRGALGEEN